MNSVSDQKWSHSGSCCVLPFCTIFLQCCGSVACLCCFCSASFCSWVALSCRHTFKVLGFNPSVMWPGHSANGRARLRFQPRRREWNKEGGRDGRQAFNCVHDLDSRPAATALLSLLLLTGLFVWPVVWVFGWHPLKRVGIPPLGKTQVCVQELSKEKRRRSRRQQTAAFLFHSSLPLQELRQWKNGGRSSDHLCE